MSDEVKLTVHELGEGWAVISFKIPPKDDALRYFWLNKTLQNWLGDNPHFVLQEVQSIRLGAKLYGLSVVCAMNKREFSVDVDNELLSKFGKEYVEAVVADCMQFITTTNAAHPIMALINRREIAVVIERQKRRASVMPLHRFRPRLTATNAQELDAWLAGTAPGYLVIPLKAFSK